MVDRRLAAILNADVVGYTRLMADDELATIEMLRSHWAVVDGFVSQHGGRVVDKVGDNLLAEFPSALAAVQSAVEIQRHLGTINANIPEQRRMLLRIGLNVGDLIVDGERIVGDGVNIAARIQSSAKPGGVSISSTVLDQVEGKLPVRVHDRGALSFKNVSRPVKVFDLETEPQINADEEEERPDILAGEHAPQGLSGRHAIAVLPFRNLSDNADQEYFADGLAEDLITSLATLRLYPIIARNSSFTYKNKSMDVRQIGRELGAHYIVTGSVRNAGSRMRVNAELVDTANARQLWSGRYDREITDIFDLQDEITVAIAGSVGPALLQSERDQAIRRPPRNLDAWECVYRSMWHLFQYSRENTEQAHAWAERALRLQPDLAQAYSMIAFSHMYEIIYQWSDDAAQSRALAARAAERAFALDQNDPTALTALGYAHSLEGEYERAIQALERAIGINPSFAMAYWALGSSMAQTGKADEGIAMIEQAIRLSPQDPLMHEFLFNVAAAHFVAGRYEAAVNFVRESLALKAGQPGALRLLAAASAYLGNHDEAAAAVERMMKVAPGMSEDHLRTFLPQTVAERYIEGLRLAGWKNQSGVPCTQKEDGS